MDVIKYIYLFNDLFHWTSILFKVAVYDISTNPSVTTWMYGSWVFLGVLDKSIYYHIATGNINTGGRQYNSPIITADILWVKNFYYKNSLTKSPLTV